MKFQGIVEATGKNTTGIPVPQEVLEALGAGKRPKVSVTLNGYSYATSVGSVEGKPMVSVSAEVREKAGVAAGDELEVDLELDTAPREVSLPPDFQAALEEDAQAKAFFDGLSYSNKRRIVLNIGGAKTEETRQRRIAKSVSALHEGRV